MFYVSTKKEPFFYKIQRIKKGTTSKGEPYTFIDICSKDKRDGDKYKNASITIWEDVRAEEGDKIAIHSVSGFNYSESESGFKRYIRVEATVDRFTIKEAEQSDSNKEQAKKPSPKPTQTHEQKETPPVQKQTTSSRAALLDDDDSGDWDGLPF